MKSDSKDIKNVTKDLYILFLFIFKFIKNPEMFLKGLVYPKMKISLCFTPLRSILDVCDFLLSDETNLSYIKNCPGPIFRRDCFRLWQ